MTSPKDFGEGYCHWTINRLQEYLNGKIGIPIKHSQLHAILKEEGLKWQKKRSWFKSPDPEFAQKRAEIIELYTNPPEKAHVVCVDEKGPIAVKVYQGRIWSKGDSRPKFQPDYSRKGYLWEFGALEPKTGFAHTMCAEVRNTESFLEFMDQLEDVFPEGTVHVILDNLSVHKSIDSLLWVWSHDRFVFHWLPTYAPWLNLIEPWWQIPKNLALTNVEYKNKKELEQGLNQATPTWMDNRHPFHWRKGRVAKVSIN